MLRLLIILGGALYAALLVGGEDKGQLRAGLRDQPVEAQPAPLPAVAAAEAQVDSPAPGSAVTLASLPAQPIRILPAPPRPEAPPAEASPMAGDAAPEVAPAEPAPNTELAWVNVDRANVRLAPSRQSSVTGRVERGEALLVLWTEPSGWVRVRVEGDGVDGFVHKSLLTNVAPPQ